MFEVNGKVYAQKLGTAIGTKFAPAYANLVMASLEEMMIEGLEVRPWVRYRFNGDVVFIWTHGEEELVRFMEYTNRCHQTTKYTLEHSKNRVI